MAAKFIILIAALAVSNAVPIWFGDGLLPGVVMRIGRSPNFAYGFGSGFSSNIGGISQSTGIGASFQSGDGQAYGAGIGASDGNAYARGVGIANAGPSSYTLAYQPYNNAIARNSYGSAVSSAQNIGNYGSAISTAQNTNGYGSAVSAVQNNGPAPYQSAISSAQNYRGLGYESAVSSANTDGYGTAISSAQNVGGYGSAVSSAQSRNGLGNFGSAVSSAQSRNGLGNFGSAVSASESSGNYRASTAQSVQQNGGVLHHSGATSINAPGIQAAQSHAINTGGYYY